MMIADIYYYARRRHRSWPKSGPNEEMAAQRNSVLMRLGRVLSNERQLFLLIDVRAKRE